jgi:hypothetical protein
VLIDYPADSGAAETQTAEKFKMAVSPQQKAMSVLWYWEIKLVKSSYSVMWRKSS